MRELLTKLRNNNIQLKLQNGELSVRYKGEVDHEILREISEKKPDLINYLKSLSINENGAIPVAVKQPCYPLSSAQHRLWVLSQMEEASIAYNIPGIYVFTGALYPDALERAFNALLKRYEILRTTFNEDDNGNICQFVHEPEDIPFAISQYDLRMDGDGETVLKELIRNDISRPLDLVKGPSFRVGIYRTQDEQWVLSYVVHHIICDDWSMNILMSDLLHYYHAYVNGESYSPGELRIHYKDYAFWQQAQLTGGKMEKHKAYWHEQFSGTLPVLDFPVDRIRPAIRSYMGGILHRRIGALLTERIKMLSQQQGGTLFMGLLAVVNTLLYRYTGQEDLITGSVVAGREHADLEDQVGFFINTIALRTTIKADDSFIKVLNHVKTAAVKAYEHQAYPFDKLVDELDFQRDISRNPLFDVMVVLQNAVSRNTEQTFAAGSGISGYEGAEHVISKFDLTFLFMETGDGLQLNIEYNQDIFDRHTIVRIGTHLEQLLMAVTQNPELPVARLDYLNAAEKQRLLYEFNDTKATYPSDKTIIDLFEDQVRQNGDNIALSYNGTAYSYTQLNELCNQFGSYLRTRYTIKRDDLIAVSLERNEWMIIVMLGVLKAGAAYVPIDPAYPQERIDYLLSDSNSSVFVNAEELEFFKQNSNDYNSENLVPVNRPDDLAYVIYTSGTTGNPKGVLIEHKNVVRLLKTNPALFDFNDTDVWTMFHSNCFDFSVWEMYGPLVSGGKLVVVPQHVIKDPEHFLQLLQEEKVTVLNQTPAAFYNLIKSTLDNKVTTLNLRYVIFGGEELSPGKLFHWRGMYPSTRLINMYGITETTVHVTYKEIGAAEIKSNISNIGRPIPTLTCYVLDGTGNLVPVGVPGELHVGGEGVARGYLNREELTAARFIKSPFMEGERLYRSGDKVRILENGDMEYMGRIDQQVKIRGYRIELGEIESALLDMPLIKQVAVVAIKDKEGDAKLVAYLIGEGELNVITVRTFLASRLPAYMIPAHYVQLSSFPLTKNGKLDKAALRDPEDISLSAGIAYVAPRNAMEETLVLIWKSVLNREGIGITHNFFDLGGDSIKILRLTAALKKELGLNIPLAYLYRNGTIGGITAYLEQNADKTDEQQKQDVEKVAMIRQKTAELKDRILSDDDITDAGNIEDIYPMSAIQKGMLFESLLNEGTGIYHDQFLFRKNFPDFDVQRFTKALKLLVSKHGILRTGFDLTSYETEVQIVYREVEVVVDYRDITSLSPAEQEQDILLFMKSELQHPFNVAQAPLWRMCIFHTGGGNQCFLWQFHHAILDGWSNASLITELNNLYLQLESTPDVVPARLKIDYKDFVIRHLADKEDEQVKAFWRNELAAFSRLDLFTQESESRRYALQVDKDYFNKLEGVASALKTNIRVVSLTAYLYMLKVIHYSNDILIGMVTNTRPDLPDSDKLLGCFLNTIPLRATIEGEISAAEMVKQMHEKLLTLKDKERLSLFDISLLNNEDTQSGNPFLDVLFNYVDFHIYDAIQHTKSENNNAQASLAGGRERTNTFLDCTVSVTGRNYTVSFTLGRKLRSGLSVEYLGQLYLRILTHIIDHPEQLIDDNVYLSPDERNLLLSELNNTDTEYPRDATLITLFEEQAIRTPDNIALIAEDGSLTFAGLQQRSNRFAAWLRERYEVNPDDLFALKMERGIAVVVAMLGILKSGAGCVPMDVELPAKRTDFISTNSNCLAVVDAVMFDQFSREEAHYSDESLPVINDAANLVYVIYTSGSTGQPKGCMLEHRGVINHLFSKINSLHIGMDDVICHSSELHFVGGLWQLWAPLLTGGRVVLSSRDTIRDMGELMNVCQQYGARILEVIPAQLNEYLLSEGTFNAGCIRTLILTGEKLSRHFVNECYRGNDNLEILNTYGQTESSDVTTSCRVEQNDDEDIVLIGRPVQNMRNYIISADGYLCPPGVIGEICTSGDGTCRGYIREPELTASKFTENPYRAGVRMYHTGDYGRLHADGQLEVTGRKDEQVKLRGHRIELGEIEAVLLQEAGVEKAIVLAVSVNSDEKRLVAYLTAREQLDADNLRARVAAYLPVYMMPSLFIQLEKLPLLPNGKTDKKALLLLPGVSLAGSIAYIAPRNATETALVDIWKMLLPQEQISAGDNFFTLGGHSLKATRLVSQIHRVLGVKLKLRDIFNHPVLEQQAKLILESQPRVYSQILPAGNRPSYPLSSAQRRLWVLSQFQESNIAYNIPGAYILEGEVDHPALEQSLNAIISRHEILRTVFREDEQSEVQQYIFPVDNLKLKIALLNFEEDPDAPEKVNRQMEADSLKPFDLKEGPLLRAVLYKLSADKWIFSYVLHHIISDRWSMDTLVQELLLFYNSFNTGRLPEILPLRIQYKDYACWQQEHLKGAMEEEHRNYWLKQLQGDLPILDLPVDNPRPAVKTYNGGVITMRLEKQVLIALKFLCRQEDATLFMGLQALVNILLYNYTGQEDIIIGSPVSGRQHADLEGQIGCYINTLALRTRFSGKDSFRQLLSNVRLNILEAYDHEIYPFDELIDSISLVRDQSRSPLFDVLIDLHDNRTMSFSGEDRLNNLEVSSYTGYERLVSKYDLTFLFMESDEALNVVLEYNSDLFKPATIKRMANHLGNLAGSIIADPAIPIEAIELMTRFERTLLLETFNDIPVNYSKYHSVITLFDEQVCSNPDNIAVKFEEVVITYAALQQRSVALAQTLVQEYGIMQGDLVGIMLDRSEHMIIAVLAILRTGAAYVPVDPVYPAARKEYIFTDTGIKALITETRYLFDIPYYSGSIIAVDAMSAIPSGQLTFNINNAPEDIAYIIYTSGSTGQPKGCMVTHGNLSHYIQWADNYYFSAPDIPHFSLFTSLSFDLTITCIFCPLTLGGSLLIYPQDAPLTEILQHSFDADSNINAIKLTPSHISILKQLELPEVAMSCVILGGEQVTEDQVTYLKSIHPAIKIYNEYGPTETTVGCVVGELEAGVPVDIGKPISNTRIYILKGNWSPVPPGVSGELYISGSGVSKGYLNNDQLTAERFLNDPFLQGNRMYRTGDFGYWLPDGRIVFTGRKDEQVKVHGFRIEQGEIEKVLLTHPAVDSAIVITKLNRDSEKELVAYIIASEQLDVTTLKTYLNSRIPAYMIPAWFVQLDEIPLTVNGKTDRGKLPDPFEMGMSGGITYVPPRSELEAQLVELIEEVLGRSPIGIYDNLFDVGANSLKLVRITGIINKRFNTVLSIVTAFRLPNVSLLADYIHSGNMQTTASEEELDAAVDTMDEMIKLYDEDGK